jgi:hypothetical protein
MNLIHAECYDIVAMVDYMRDREYHVQQVHKGDTINFKKRVGMFLYTVQFVKVKDDSYRLNSAYVYTINDDSIVHSNQMTAIELGLI